MENPFRINYDSRASNPGNVTLSPYIWLKHNPETSIKLFLVIVISILVLTYIPLRFIAIPGVILFALYRRAMFYWTYMKEHFALGDSNGGIVISENPSLVAVTTDFTKGFGTSYPVVKIIKYKGKGKLGDKIGTVALYTASTDESLPHWIDFDPIPIEYATNNPEEISKAIESYDENQWIQIQDRLKEIPKPFKAGLYKVEVDSSDWSRL